jgi:hypothetical protein
MSYLNSACRPIWQPMLILAEHPLRAGMGDEEGNPWGVGQSSGTSARRTVSGRNARGPKFGLKVTVGSLGQRGHSVRAAAYLQMDP